MKVTKELKDLSELILNTFDPERLKQQALSKV